MKEPLHWKNSINKRANTWEDFYEDFYWCFYDIYICFFFCLIYNGQIQILVRKAELQLKRKMSPFERTSKRFFFMKKNQSCL